MPVTREYSEPVILAGALQMRWYISRSVFSSPATIHPATAPLSSTRRMSKRWSITAFELYQLLELPNFMNMGRFDGDNSSVFCSNADVLETSKAAAPLPTSLLGFARSALRRLSRRPLISTTAPSAVASHAPELLNSIVALCFSHDSGLGPL